MASKAQKARSRARRLRVVRLLCDGWSKAEIARHLGLNRSTISKRMRRYRPVIIAHFWREGMDAGFISRRTGLTPTQVCEIFKTLDWESLRHDLQSLRQLLDD